MTEATAEASVDLRFDSIPRTAENHFRLRLFATVCRVLLRIRADSDGEDSFEATLEKHPFLKGYLAEIARAVPEGATWAEGLDAWERGLAEWEEQAADRLPLRVLVDTLGLESAHLAAFMLAGLLEEDARFGALVADIQAPLPHRRPCLELIGRIAASAPSPDPWRTCRPLLRNGLVKALNPDAPRSEWLLHVPAVLWDVARGDGEPGPDAGYRVDRHDACEPLEDLVLPDAFRERAAQVPSLVEDGRARAVVVRGSPGSDRFAVIRAIAARLGRDTVTVDADHLKTHAEALGPLCTMAGALPVVTADPGTGETVRVPTLRGYHGPIGVVLGPEGGVEGPSVDQAVNLSIPALSAADRRRCWEQALGPAGADDVETLTERFHLPTRYIRQAAAGAVTEARLHGRNRVAAEDVRRACRTLNTQRLQTLADPIEPMGDWSQLVTGGTTRTRLGDLERRCRHRERVLDHLGPAFAGTGRGVRALFTGPSGCGKSLAAKVLAAELGKDLFRVDLAAVINKYIGETEKNLQKVLATAEELDVVLLLDEGDALLGGRTEVQSANDRYANLQTDYLLQRLEHYEGIALVTTNLSGNIDPAFERRMDVVVDFQRPDQAERHRIWQLHLPRDHGVDDAFLQEVAARCPMNGGQIRNAAMQAALHAVDAGETLAREHLEEAIRTEYRKAGATCPIAERQPDTVGARSNVEAFLESIE